MKECLSACIDCHDEDNEKFKITRVWKLLINFQGKTVLKERKEYGRSHVGASGSHRLDDTGLRIVAVFGQPSERLSSRPVSGY
jgi:hypothetical protein